MSGNNVAQKSETGSGDTVAPLPQPPPAKGWVHFDEEAADGKESQPAVINTESIQVNLERSISSLNENSGTPARDGKTLRNVELPVATVEPIRQGFSNYHFIIIIMLLLLLLLLLVIFNNVFLANGDIIVTLLPVNTRLPWITPAKFRPELVPEELMAQGLTVSSSVLYQCDFYCLFAYGTLNCLR